MGQYSERLASARMNQSPEQIRYAKNQRCKARNELKREIRREMAEFRNETWNSLTPEQQIASLDRRLGAGAGAVKQRKAILAKMAK